MSTALHEKIRLIREVECLSRAEFAQLTGISSRTIETIENKGNTPRGDVLEKIASKWPEYSFWLMTGKSQWPTHLAPVSSEQTVLRFFETIVDPRPEVDELMTKPEWFSRLVFLQCSDEKNDLFAFIETNQTTRSGIKQCILVRGRINFCSDGSGKNGLIDLAKFLIGQNRGDLIKACHMRLVTQTSLDGLFNSWEINEDQLMVPDLAKAEWLRKVHINLTAWKMSAESYEPKYNWNNMK